MALRRKDELPPLPDSDPGGFHYQPPVEIPDPPTPDTAAERRLLAILQEAGLTWEEYCTQINPLVREEITLAAIEPFANPNPEAEFDSEEAYITHLAKLAKSFFLGK